MGHYEDHFLQLHVRNTATIPLRLFGIEVDGNRADDVRWPLEPIGAEGQNAGFAAERGVLVLPGSCYSLAYSMRVPVEGVCVRAPSLVCCLSANGFST